MGVGATATAEEIRDFCQGHIASYKVPVQVVFLRSDEFPRTNTGKVEKMALRQVMAAHLGHPLLLEPVGMAQGGQAHAGACDWARRDRPGLVGRSEDAMNIQVQEQVAILCWSPSTINPAATRCRG